MRFLGYVILPLALQLIFTFAIIALNTGNGSFVGLGAMVLGLYALPITAIINWLGTRARPALPSGRLLLRTLIVSSIWPVLLVAGHVLAT